MKIGTAQLMLHLDNTCTFQLNLPLLTAESCVMWHFLLVLKLMVAFVLSLISFILLYLKNCHAVMLSVYFGLEKSDPMLIKPVLLHLILLQCSWTPDDQLVIIYCLQNSTYNMLWSYIIFIAVHLECFMNILVHLRGW